MIEPDADGDGFGDETQDGCPTQDANQGACDTAGPGIGGIVVGATTVSYQLSEAATLTFRVQRQAKGRRVRGRCRPQTRRNRNRPRCTRLVALRGSFSDDGEAGANVKTLPRRFRPGVLRPGRYRLVITAVDRFGNQTQTTKRFRVR